MVPPWLSGLETQKIHGDATWIVIQASFTLFQVRTQRAARSIPIALITVASPARATGDAYRTTFDRQFPGPFHTRACIAFAASRQLSEHRRGVYSSRSTLFNLSH